MRVSTAFNQLLRLDGASVRDVRFGTNTITVTVALRRRRLVCPECPFSTTAAYEACRPDVSGWRHLDLGSWRLEVRAHLRRLVCPTHGVRVEGVPFARPGARFTRDLESLVAWLATSTDQAAIARLVRIDWATVGRICARVVADELDPARLENLFVVGVDEVSWRANHNHLTLVTNHANHKTVWGAEGKDTAALDRFFDELGPERSAAIEAVSMDMGPAYAKSVRAEGHAPQAVICYDPLRGISRNGSYVRPRIMRSEQRRPWSVVLAGVGAEHNSARSEAVEEGEQSVRRSVASRPGVRWPGAGESSFFDRQVRVDVDPGGGLDLLMTEPQGDDRGVNS